MRILKILAVFLFYLPVFAQNQSVVDSLAAKSPRAEGLQYVAAFGSDSNDGLSWATAKRTIFEACEALWGGGVSPPTCGSGTIYYMSGALANPNRCAGIWLMGKGDPNYVAPPLGWLRVSSEGMTIIGLEESNHGPNAHIGRSAVVAGCSEDRDHPGIWLSGTSNPMHFVNIAIQYPGRGIVIGESSKHERNGKANVSAVTFDNVTANLNQKIGNGPAWDITGQSYWLSFHDCGGSGLASVNRYTDNNAAAFLFDGVGNAGNGLIYLDGINTSTGGIKIVGGNGNTPALISISNYTMEGSFGGHSMPAAVWITGTGVSGGTITLRQIAAADVPHETYAVQVDAGVAENVVVDGAVGGGPDHCVLGPAVLLSGCSYTSGSYYRPASGGPFTQGQEGLIGGYIFAHTDAARRLFGPTAVRFENLASTAPSGWVIPDKITLKTGIGAPDSTNGAGRVTNSTGFQNGPYFYGQVGGTSTNIGVGDWLIGGVWARYNSGPGWAGGTVAAIGVSHCKISYATIPAPPNQTGSINFGPATGGWTWASTALKVAGVSNNPCSISFNGNLGANGIDSADYYAPIYFRIPALTLSDDEVMMIFHNLESYDTSCKAGSVCGLPGQTLTESRFGTLSNCSSNSSPATCGSAAAGSVTVAAGATTQIIETTAVTANSQILLTFDSSIGKKLGVNCNKMPVQGAVSERIIGKRFTLLVQTAPKSSPACFSYEIIN